MDPMKIRLYNELNAKENRNVKLIDKFYPTPKTKPITGKFYAKHEAIASNNASPEYLHVVTRAEAHGPTDIYKYRPPSVNMEYGWFVEPLIPRSNDVRLYFPSKRSSFVKHELKSRQLHKGVPFKKFTGSFIPAIIRKFHDSAYPSSNGVRSSVFECWQRRCFSLDLWKLTVLVELLSRKTMAGRGFCVKIDLDVHAVTCPGVWLCPNGKVALRLNAFNNCIESRHLTPIFPLLFHDKFNFKKTFTGVATLTDLQRSLEEEFLYTELIQWSSPESRSVILATFETNLVDLLYPAPCFKGLLAGVDVDLLMEPTKYFPGIIAPKIEISTRTVIKEVFGICDSFTPSAHVVNPKMINSKSPQCFRRKPLSKGIIRQRKVCHTQGKHRSQICKKGPRKKNQPLPLPEPCCSCGSCNKCCSEKPSSYDVERIYAPAMVNRRSLSQSDDCYHKTSMTSRQKHCGEHTTVCDDSHVFESCPVCSKYKCYFACSCAEQDDLHACKYKARPEKIHERKCVKDPSPQRDNNSCACRPTTAPSPREDPSTLLLRAKMRQLQKTKAKLSHICNGRKEDSSSNEQCCDQTHDRSHGRQGFYKNLEKFYKKMYKQARMRAQEVDCV